MKLDVQNISRAFAPSLMARVTRTFDRATMVVVLTCWGGALFVMMFALYTLNLSVTAKGEALAAAAREPSLPRIVSKEPETAEMQPIADRLKRRFPDISFTLSREHTLSVSAGSVSNFRLWLTVLSYIDTISPQYRWTIKEFCVGSGCGKGTPMQAVLTAERISFSAPEAAD